MTRICTGLVWLRSMKGRAADWPSRFLRCGQVEVVERIAGRVARRDVQGVEVVIGVLDFRPARHGEAEPPEQVDQLVGGLRERMTVSHPGQNARQRDIEPRLDGRPAFDARLRGVEGGL